MNVISEIKIDDYHDEMMDQIVAINVEQYGGDPEERRRTFKKIFTSSFVEGKSIPIVAMEGRNVVGVQTYRYWPYSYQGKTFNSLQSGGTIVKNTHRGRGLFMRMLAFGNHRIREKGIVFVTGIPVRESYGGLIKDGWTHLCSPVWFVKIIRPTKLLAQKQQMRKPEEDSCVTSCFDDKLDDSKTYTRCLSNNLITLSTSREFLKYRYSDAPTGKYLFWKNRTSDPQIVFVCRMSWIHGYHELLIGDVLCESESESTVALVRAFSNFLADVNRATSVVAVTMLVGGRTMEWLPLLLGNGFLPYPKRIRFTMKNFSMPEEDLHLVEDKLNWSIMQADLDTW